MTEEEAEALKKKKMYMGIGIAICVLLIIIIAVVAGVSGANDANKPFVRLCLPGYFHDGDKCRLNCDQGCKECDEKTRACTACSSFFMMTKNRTGDAQCLLEPCQDKNLFNAGQGCKPCGNVLHGCTKCVDAFRCRTCNDGLVRSPMSRCYHPATFYNPCYLNDFEGSVIEERGSDSRYVVLDGCLHDMSLLALEGLYGEDISTFKVYDYGYVKEQKWPIGYPVTYMKFGT